jgi:hypothetical protein
MYSRKNDVWILHIASTVKVRNHAGPSNNARPTSEKLLRFRRSFSSVVDPPRDSVYRNYVYCAGLGECNKTAIALPARYMALAAIMMVNAASPVLCQ